MVWNVNVAFVESPIHGMGVFARERIPAGTKIWQFDRSMHVNNRHTLALLAPETISFALLGGYVHRPSGRFLWYEDGMEFMNHGRVGRANVGLHYWPKLEDDHIVALRDIEAGEEMLENYGSCLSAGLGRDHWLRPFYLDHCPGHYAFLLHLVKSAPRDRAADQEPVRDGKNCRTIAMSASSSIGFDKTARKPDAKQAA